MKIGCVGLNPLNKTLTKSINFKSMPDIWTLDSDTFERSSAKLRKYSLKEKRTSDRIDEFVEYIYNNIATMDRVGKKFYREYNTLLNLGEENDFLSGIYYNQSKSKTIDYDIINGKRNAKIITIKKEGKPNIIYSTSYRNGCKFVDISLTDDNSTLLSELSLVDGQPYKCVQFNWKKRYLEKIERTNDGFRYEEGYFDLFDANHKTIDTRKSCVIRENNKNRIAEYTEKTDDNETRYTYNYSDGIWLKK